MAKGEPDVRVEKELHVRLPGVEVHVETEERRIARLATESKQRGDGRRLRFRRSVESFVAVNAFLVAIWFFTGQGGFWPIFPILGWGLGLTMQWIKLRDAAPAAVVDPLPSRVGLLERQLGPSVGEALRRGLAEVRALEAFRGGLDVAAAIAEARGEAETLRARAAEAGDAEARATWERSAETAERRVERLALLRTEHERAAAQIEAFNQLLKNLELDTAGSRPETEAIAELGGHAARIEAEVTALHRTNEELARLQARVRA